jgi:formylglycine-generating enzyme required for sulfatase activity
VSDVYIGYTREDKDRAEQLAAVLEKQGLSVSWIARFEVDGQLSEWTEEVLRKVSCVIMLWSASGFRSSFFIAQAIEAFYSEKLLPVKLDEAKRPSHFKAKLPLILKEIQPFDLTGWRGDSDDPRLEHLLLTIKHIGFRVMVVEDELSIQSQLTQAKEGVQADKDDSKVEQRIHRLSAFDWRRSLNATLVVITLLSVITASLMLTRLGLAGMDRIGPGSSAVAPCQSAPGQGPQMVIIPPGRFTMGVNVAVFNPRSDDQRAREVTISRAFAIGRCEVTFSEYEVFANATERKLPSDEGWAKGRRPVINVSWEDAVAYAAWLSQQTGERYRLPTEAEWEYAAKAGSTTRYWWGDEVRQADKVWANCDGCGSQWDGQQTAPVGSFTANGFGIYDMTGNAGEWVEDCTDAYRTTPDEIITSPKSNKDGCGSRVIRGGGWSDPAHLVYAAYRYGFWPNYANNNLSFRLVRDL